MGTPTTTCFDLVDSTGFNAVEFTKVNFEGSGSIGTLDGFRQGLWTSIGVFGLSDGLTFEGTWLGGFKSETVIVRSLTGSTGSLFKKGASLQFNSRFSIDSNIDLPVGWSITDFEPNNFSQDNLLQVQGAIVTRAGVIDSQDVNYFPNIDEKNDVSDWRNNVGVKNTYKGGEWEITTETVTAIATAGTFVKLAGTTTYDDLQHFSDGGGDNTLTSSGSLTKDVLIRFQGVIDGGANDEIAVKIRIFRSNTSTYEDIKTRVRTISNIVGANNIAYFNFYDKAFNIQENDRIEVWAANNSDTTGITLLVNSQLVVEARG